MKVGAWLIQGLSGYLAELEPHLTRILTQYSIERDDFVLWLVRREMLEVYNLYEHRCHALCPQHYDEAYQDLRDALPFNIQSCFMHYFKAPRLYDTAEIEVHLRSKTVVCIGYLTHLKNFHQR
jgi:hypothetical protein